jgi:hypothetical protein
LDTSSVSASSAVHWHIRISPASGLTNFLPGACGQPSRTRPDTAFALQVPQVPVAHS